jgi:LysM repeat protein
MDTSQSSNARLAAIIALAVAFIVLVVVIVSSLGGGGGGGGGSGGTAAQTVGHQKPAKSAPSGSKRKVYIVKPGDTFSGIANKLGLSVEKLQALNPGIDQFSLHSGDQVKLR